MNDILKKFLIKSNEELQTELDFDIDSKKYYEDAFLLRYQEKEYVLDLSKKNQIYKQSGGDFNKFKKLWDNDKMMKNYEKIERKLNILYKKAFDKIFNPYFSTKFLTSYYCKKYFNNDDYGIFYYLNSISGIIKETTANILPDKKYNSLVLYFNYSYGDFLNNIAIIIDLIKYIFDNNLNNNSECIIRLPLVLHNEKLYNFIEYLHMNFEILIISFPLTFNKRTLFSYIILKNKIRKDKIDLSNYLFNYYNKINNYLLKEIEFEKKLLEIFIQNPLLFKIIFNKINSYTYNQFSIK